MKINKKGFLDIRMLAGLAIVGVILLFGSSLYNNFDGWLQTTLNGPEYCFLDIDQSSIAVASQGVEVKYTKTEGDELCFRTKDHSIVERLNQQIQDRKLDAELARIKANERFWNETFPGLFIIGLIALGVIAIIIYLSTGRNYHGF